MRQDLVLFRYMRGLFWGGLVVAVLLYAPVLVTVLGAVGSFAGVSTRTVDGIGDAGNLANIGISNLTILASLVAVLIGATAGSIDHQTGMLRDLVLAGRSRSAIALRRIAAGATWLLGATAVALVVILVAAVTLAPVGGSMSFGDTLGSAASMLPGLAAALLLGAGFALLLGSRGIAVGAFFLFSLIIDNVLIAIPKVGHVWEQIALSRAVDQVTRSIDPTAANDIHDVSLTHAVIVLVAWCVIPLALGLLRLSRRDL